MRRDYALYEYNEDDVYEDEYDDTYDSNIAANDNYDGFNIKYKKIILTIIVIIIC